MAFFCADGRFEIPYQQTEHVLMRRRFLNDPEGVLGIVLNRDLYGD
jgi:predicted ATPase